MKRAEIPQGPIADALDRFWALWQEYVLIADRGLAFEAAEKLADVEEQGAALRRVLRQRGL